MVWMGLASRVIRGAVPPGVHARRWVVSTSMRTEASRDTSEPLASSEDVKAAASAARAHGRIGIDTEFMSEGRYRALLCLVQIAVDDDNPDEDPRISLIDPLDGVDVTPLAELLADPAIEVVFHAGRQDVAILRRAWNTEITNIFDTQLAAGFVGASAQTGYGNLLGTMLGRRVGKTASYTRWDARPLTAEQLSYAAEDVAHLLELSDEIQRRLRESGRLNWAREECRRLESATDERDPVHGLGAAAARRPARPACPRGRARAGGLARAHRVRRGSAGRVGARRPGPGRARQAPPARTSAHSSRSVASTRRGSAAAARRCSMRSPPA